MGIIDINLRPSRRQLRQFGVLTLVAFGVLGGMTLWKGSLFGSPLGEATRTVAGILWGAGVAGGLLAAVFPAGLLPLYWALLAITYPIGYVVSHLIMLLLFYGILTPIGIFFRVIGRDPLHRRMDPDAESYWVDHRPPESTRRYFRQF